MVRICSTAAVFKTHDVRLGKQRSLVMVVQNVVRVCNQRHTTETVSQDFGTEWAFGARARQRMRGANGCSGSHPARVLPDGGGEAGAQCALGADSMTWNTICVRRMGREPEDPRV
jgi:hypothetical protein